MDFAGKAKVFRNIYVHGTICALSLIEPVFLNVYGAQESIPRNEFRQPMEPGGPVR
jgi:hypothetical protein